MLIKKTPLDTELYKHIQTEGIKAYQLKLIQALEDALIIKPDAKPEDLIALVRNSL